MILLYRITPFLVALICALGFAGVLFRVGHPFFIIAGSVLLVGIALARLLQWRGRDFSFWFFLGIAAVFLVSSFGMLFLFETRLVSIWIACSSTGLLVLLTEFLFLYTHLPTRYQPFSLEHLTSLLNLLSIFYAASFGFAARLLIQFPFLVLALSFFLLSFFLLYGMLWVTKAESFRSHAYAMVGAVLLTELFVSIGFFPTGFYTSAAFITIFSYAYFGLTRTEAVHTLAPDIIKRYLITSGMLLLLVAMSSKWL